MSGIHRVIGLDLDPSSSVAAAAVRHVRGIMIVVDGSDADKAQLAMT